MNRIFLSLTLCAVAGLAHLNSAKANTQSSCLACPNIFTKRYAMFSCDLRTKSAAERTKRFAILNRVHRAGYNAIIHYNNLMVMSRNSKTWLDNFKEITAEARRLGLAQGMYDGAQKHASFHDLNVAEAFPAIGTRYMIEAGRGKLIPDHSVTVKNAGFDEFSGNGHAPTGWKLQGLGPGTSCFADAAIKRSGKSSVRMVRPKYPAALVQRITVKPHRAYRLSIWIKTDKFDKPKTTSMAVMGAKNMWVLHITESDPFGWGQYAVASTQNWKRSVIDFNSLNNTSVSIYLYPSRSFGQANGTLWFDDFTIEEVGLYEAVKRNSAPVKVTAANGTPYVENKDYTLDIDAKFNYQGKLTIPEGSDISNGDTLRVDWYQLANVDYFRIPDAVGCIQEYYDYLEKDMRVVHEILNPLQIVFAQLGEWRVAFWDPHCIAQFKTAGAYMAATAMRTRNLCRKINPQMEVGFKNDMFDPFHNQLANPYYMTNGSMIGSDVGITQDVSMSNWIFATSGDSGTALYNSTMFWGGMHPKYPRKLTRQLLRVNADGGSSDLPFRLAALKKLEAKGLRGVNGVLYNTWYQDYATLESVADMCKEAGRWATNPWISDSCQLALYDPSVKVTKSLASHPDGVRLTVSRKGQKALISYALTHNSKMELRIMNVAGRCVKRLFAGRQLPGSHELAWNPSDAPAGVYVVSLLVRENGNTSKQQRISRRFVRLE